MPQLNEDFGAFTVAIVIAHEYGHAVQARFGTPDRTVDLELQADCFAGAWTQRVADGSAEGFDAGDVDLDKTVAGMISIRDLPSTDPNDPMAHGSGFDRVGAFQDGYENGAEKCAEYADPGVDRRTAEIPFRDQDYETEGNLPLEDDWDGQGSLGLYSLVEQDLNEFYGWYLDQLGTTWTPVDDLVVVDPTTDEVTCGGDELSGTELEYAALYCEDENIVVHRRRRPRRRPLRASVTSRWPASSASCGPRPRSRSSGVGEQRRCHPAGRLHDRVLGSLDLPRRRRRDSRQRPRDLGRRPRRGDHGVPGLRHVRRRQADGVRAK